MNTRPPGQPSPKADAAAREWALQERATRDVREGADGEANDAAWGDGCQALRRESTRERDRDEPERSPAAP